MSADAVFSGRAPPPAEGARFDLYVERPVKGPKRMGLGGVDSLWAQFSHISVSHIPPSFTASSLKTSSAVRCNSDGQAIAVMMEERWRSAIHPDRIEGIGASARTTSRRSKTLTINVQLRRRQAEMVVRSTSSNHTLP